MYPTKIIVWSLLLWCLNECVLPSITPAKAANVENIILLSAPTTLLSADNDEQPLQIALIGVVRSQINKRPILGANVELLVADTGESIHFTTDKDGSFHFRLQPNTAYEIHVITEGGVVNHTKKITTERLIKSTILHAFIELP